MTRFLCAVFILLSLSHNTKAATYKLTGMVADSTGNVLNGASVSLLNPQDSTLAFFGISNEKGIFTITDVGEGSYMLQVAMMGYYTEYRKISVPAQNDNNLGAFLLKVNDAGSLLNEVVISGEKIPIRLKGDTIEYNAGSFKVKPDAVVEDLLRKLPGVEVDREGNIKSMGKSVSKVTVDGKEFFGTDPKIATKNLPADAIDKIQAFESKSEGSLFTGVDDGSREQTLNLTLKDGRKTGYFGEAKGGLGIPQKYETSLKAFKFRPKSQIAVLGMLNNVNKFGFTFNDYFNFNGGLSSLMQGNSSLKVDSDEPIDFGQPIPGDITSGALGLNYSIEPYANSRLNLHYMGNGARKLLEENSTSQNFTPTGTFKNDAQSHSTNANLANRLAASWRSQIDSIHLLKINLTGQLGNNKNDEQAKSTSSASDQLLNTLERQNYGRGSKQELAAAANWYTRLKGKWPVLEADFNAQYKRSKSDTRWNNLTTFTTVGQTIADNQYRTNDGRQLTASGKISAVRSLGNSFFLLPSVSAGIDRQSNNRIQGPLANESQVTDTLSPEMGRNIITIAPGLELKRNRKKLRWSLGLNARTMWLNPSLNGTTLYNHNYNYLLPYVRWENDLSNGQRLTLSYNTHVNAPEALQLLPVTDFSNPLYRLTGNTNLKQEYEHNVNLNYNRFNQFNMSSFFIMMNGSYTRDKIGWSRTIQPDLSQDLLAVNTDYALQATLNAQYSRPVRKLGLQITADLQETWNRTLSPVNGVGNINNSLSHQLELSFSNLNSDVWDIRGGGSVQISTAAYSLNKELNNTYYNYTGFASIGYRPTENWNFQISGDLTYYAARSFDNPLTVPLLKAEITRYIFKNQRGAISLNGFDLLDKNKAVTRTSQLNYLMEQRSNIIGRYFMLSFSYKLNKAGRKADPGGVIIKAR